MSKKLSLEQKLRLKNLNALVREYEAGQAQQMDEKRFLQMYENYLTAQYVEAHRMYYGDAMSDARYREWYMGIKNNQSMIMNPFAIGKGMFGR